jgi:membrane protease YdiL (CAAX protease family)
MPTDVPLPPAMQALIIAVAGIGIATTLLMATNAWRRPPLLPYEPRRPVPWGANDLVLTLLFVLVLGYIAGQTVAHFYQGQPADASTAAEFYANSAVELGGVLIGIVLVRFQAGASWADLGLNTSRFNRDLGLGAAAFLASVVPICGLQALLENLVAYKHPLIEALKAQPDRATFMSTTIAALVAAPLFEEFLFRVLLQGWFEAIEWRRRVVRLGISGEGPAWWPILLSAALFAMLHIGQGPAPIPLFFLALVLGYLYQRTHRIWPSLVTHFLLNAGSMLILWSQIRHIGA